ncbi:CAP domain-containing protein [Streptomyces sp. DSM 41527]|uniref:CAP domain-containing protein n=1 Tax=Streptomyces mooreae TaxID=3075523 RepID=A0ABU2T583_9ACTN|nr:CAP domain-containing protein [Streptomyces sp. DSM 41527]MDT0456377.1 CAP domain-containing protein [Streptomyces sp. DSM 41527]
MTKHRRTRRYRQITVAALAIGAVGIPSAAMACLGHGKEAGRHHGHWRNASYDHRQAKAKWGFGQTAGASQKPAASSGATKTAGASKAAAPASGDAARVVELVNKERSKAGCSPLTVNAKLTKAAQDHSKDMADHKNMSHTGSDGSSPDDRITRAGYHWNAYGENVAYGYSTPEKVMAGWMSSPGHKRNILDCSFKEIGVGLAQPGDYWTQDFGTAG